MHAGLAMQPLPPDASISELEAVRDFCAGLGEALAAIPDPLRHHFGGDLIVAFWDPADPSKIVHLVTSFLLIRRHLSGDLDGSPIVDAVRAQGWLNADASRAPERLGLTVDASD